MKSVLPPRIVTTLARPALDYELLGGTPFLEITSPTTPEISSKLACLRVHITISLLCRSVAFGVIALALKGFTYTYATNAFFLALVWLYSALLVCVLMILIMILICDLTSVQSSR